jgi:hypothetical protein
MTEAIGDETPQEVVRRKARAVVEDACGLGWEGPPFDPAPIASLRGVTIQDALEDIRADGRIYPGRDGALIVETRPNLSIRRKRFTICHEIAHTLFPDCYEMVRFRGIADAKHRELEALCNLAAGEFLMPLNPFLRELAGQSPSIPIAETLSQRFEASLEATLRRLVDVSNTPLALLNMSRRLKPSEIKENDNTLGLEGLEEVVAPIPKLRIDYTWVSQSFKAHIPEHKSAPDGSVAYQVLESAGCLPTKENWALRGLGDWMVEATTAPPVEGFVDRVLVLVKPF